VVLDQVTQRAGPGRGGVPAAGGGLDCPPSLDGEVSGGVQGGEGDVQVPGDEGLAGLAGGLGDGRDGPGGLGGDGRVRPRLGAGVRLLLLGGAVRRDRGGLAGVGRLGGGLPVAGGLGGRGLVGRGFRGGVRPGVGDAGPTAFDPSGGAVLLVREQCLPGGGGADPGAGGDDRDGGPGGFGRQGGQGGRCGAVARRRGNGARGPGSSPCRRRCGPRAGRGRGCVP
jgi:hypothetical protein